MIFLCPSNGDVAATAQPGALFFDFEGWKAFPKVFSGCKSRREVAFLDRKGASFTGEIERKRIGKGSARSGRNWRIAGTRATWLAGCADTASVGALLQVVDCQRFYVYCSAHDVVLTWTWARGRGPRRGGGGGCGVRRCGGNDDGLRRTRILGKGFHRSDDIQIQAARTNADSVSKKNAPRWRDQP